ncbi:MAG TPA: hypothetical protein VGK48_14475 [Terriglobia bacterium]|jgi:uncharacterized protein involved in exopolysaccharide biosynthesis
MSDIVIVIVLLTVIGAALLAAATAISELLVRARARRLPPALVLRMEEEWLAELKAIHSRPSKLAFAIALTFTRRSAFGAVNEDSMSELHDHPSNFFTLFSGWKSLLTMTTTLFALAAYGLSFFLPVRYASEALIITKPADVPAVVAPGLTTSSHIIQQLDGTRQLLLSRTNLVNLIREFSLVDSGKDRLTLDQRVQQIRDSISITVDPGYEKSGNIAFTLRFVGRDPKTVQKIASKLVTLFLEQSSQSREQEVYGSVLFLQVQLDELGKRLTEKSKLLSPERTGKGDAIVHALDYEMLQSTYKSVFARLEEARMTEYLETRQKGAQFVIVDPPFLPDAPIGPDRMAIAGIGGAGGCLFGLIAIAGLSRRRRRALA